MKNILIRPLIALPLLAVTPLTMAATVYLAEIDPLQSDFFINFDDATTFQLSGTLKITVDSGTIQFEDIDIVSTPTQNIDDMILSDIASYDGLNFEYVLCDTCLGNSYNGTFDGDSLLLQGITFGSSTYNYVIASSSITSVPVPGSLLLFSSGLVGMNILYRKNKSNKKRQGDA